MSETIPCPSCKASDQVVRKYSREYVPSDDPLTGSPLWCRRCYTTIFRPLPLLSVPDSGDGVLAAALFGLGIFLYLAVPALVELWFLPQRLEIIRLGIEAAGR
jgi:hypothetical protein